MEDFQAFRERIQENINLAWVPRLKQGPVPAFSNFLPPSGHLDRQWRCTCIKRVIGFVIACGLMCLLRFAAESEGQLHRPFDRLSKQALNSDTSAASALSDDKRPNFDAQVPESLAPFPALPPPDDEEYMAICMAVKNQSIDLPEFFTHYYYHHGIRRFYIFDDGTEPPLSSASYPIPSQAITWVYFQPYLHSDTLGDREGIQEKYYTSCVNIYGDKHTWMGFLDADEFLEMTGGETLSDFLHDWARNDTVGAVGVNWLLHSSAGLLTRPSEGPRKAFNRCIVDNPQNDNLKVKTFVRTALFGEMWNVHCVAVLKDGAVQVGEHGDEINPSCDREPITRERWGLHHYGPKSREEFLQKQARGKIRGGKSDEEWWGRIENAEQRDCLELTGYVP